jgi:hypothetical protein
LPSTAWFGAGVVNPDPVILVCPVRALSLLFRSRAGVVGSVLGLVTPRDGLLDDQ